MPSATTLNNLQKAAGLRRAVFSLSNASQTAHGVMKKAPFGSSFGLAQKSDSRKKRSKVRKPCRAREINKEKR